MRTLAACLCQLALLVCLAPLPTSGSEEQTGEVEEGIAQVIDRRSSPEIASRERPSGRLIVPPPRPAISADRAILAAARHALPGHVLPNGLRAPLRC